MRSVTKYLSDIGRRGGIKSRRTLDPETSRRMVAIREARRAARRVALANTTHRIGGTPRDTTAAAQAIQDSLLLRATPAAKIAMVARLSRMVDALSLAGLRARHPNADDQMIRRLRAELRLGRELAGVVYDEPPEGA